MMGLRALNVIWGKVLRESRARGSALIDRTLHAWGIKPAMPKEAMAEGSYLLYVCETLPARAVRMAKWVARTDGSRIILLCHRDGAIPAFGNAGFEQVLLYRNSWHLRQVVNALPKPRLVHGFAPKSRYPDVVRRALQPQGVPYIHDLQDTLVVYYGTDVKPRWLREELPHERACMHEADGVIAHSLEPNEGFRRYGIARKDRPPTLFFPLYCDDDVFADAVPKISDTEIHLVYAGGVAGSHRDPKHYGNIQFFGLIETLTAQGLHFHIYPSPTTIAADREEYQALARANPCFHFHDPVSQEHLARELARYHFGILPFFKELSEQSEAKLEYATSLKLFNYLEAGLPIIVSRDIAYQSWLVERYGAGVSVTYGELSTLAERLRLVGRMHLAEARKRLGLREATVRLGRFYQRVITGG